MVVPVALAGIGGALASIVGGISAVAGAISQQPILAYFMVVGILILDGGISYTLNNKGIFGELLSFVFGQLGVPIAVYSWHVLMLIVIFPIVMFAIKSSANN
jgi:hypothetical protein